MTSAFDTKFINKPIVYLNAMICYSLVIVLTIGLLFDLIKSIIQRPRSTKHSNDKYIKISVILWLSLSFCIMVSMTINNLALYLMSNKSLSDETLITNDEALIALFEISINTSIIMLSISLFLIGFFLKITFEHIYEHQWFGVNKFLNNIIFIVYAISSLILGFVTKYNSVPGIMCCIYCIYMLILFNVKLRKFVSLGMNNNEKLSQEVIVRITRLVFKQANLTTIIILMNVILTVTTLIYNLHQNIVFISIIWNWIVCVCQSIMSISLFLSFNFNNDKYIYLCKCCDGCLIDLCDKIETHNNQSKQALSKYDPLIVTQATEDMGIYDINSYANTCAGNGQCKIVEQMCNVLKRHNKADDILEYIQSIKCSSTDILDHFNHLLLCHDSEEAFEHIYKNLDAGNHNKYAHCVTYLRHHIRRRRRKSNDTIQIREENNSEIYEDEVKEPLHEQKRSNVIVNILDKLHSFYYHSYDRLLRSKKRSNAIFKKLVETENSIGNGDSNNKFNSHFDENDKAVYSVGQRFEYENENKNMDWFVQAKYANFKDELQNNVICHISAEIYCQEYDKCAEFMESVRVKKMKSKNQNTDKEPLLFQHILSLLVYCNCDKYQSKCSETFRRMSNNECDKSLKDRHSHFYYSSMYLRQLVEDFGIKLIDDKYNPKDIIFYHGVCQRLFFPKTVAQFNGPLSTTSQVNVALNFSSHTGLVLALKYAFSTYPLNAKFFKCSFFSDYTSEKECLFIGGIPMLIIMDIIDVSNNYKSYEKYINALNILNSVMNGTYKVNHVNYVVADSAIELCASLLNGKSQRSDGKIYPQYVVNLLDKYCLNLKHIMVFWSHIESMKQLNEVFCNESLPFFNLDAVLALFPKMEQIEYYNQSFTKKIIKKIIKYISTYNIETYNLKHIIIHHSIPNIKFETCNNNWNLYQDEKKIILYFENENEFDVNLISIRFDEINQGHISSSMLQRFTD